MKNIFKNKIILVTGGTGSIGSVVVNELLKKIAKPFEFLVMMKMDYTIPL